MWQADEAWRATLRNVRLADMIDTLTVEVPPDIWQGTYQWVLAKAG